MPGQIDKGQLEARISVELNHITVKAVLETVDC